LFHHPHVKVPNPLLTRSATTTKREVTSLVNAH
jgi:hypothetical protein